MTLEQLAPYIALIIALGTFYFGAAGLRRDRGRDLAEELRNCERERERLRRENVELYRQLFIRRPTEGDSSDLG